MFPNNLSYVKCLATPHLSFRTPLRPKVGLLNINSIQGNALPSTTEDGDLQIHLWDGSDLRDKKQNAISPRFLKICDWTVASVWLLQVISLSNYERDLRERDDAFLLSGGGFNFFS